MRLDKKVLVVDDDLVVLETLREWLERLGCQVLLRTEALGTVAQVRRERPEVVLLDVSMPALSGERLAQLLLDESRKQQRMKVIFHSAQELDALDALVAKYGAHGAIRKTPNEAAFAAQFQRLVLV